MGVVAFPLASHEIATQLRGYREVGRAHLQTASGCPGSLAMSPTCTGRKSQYR